MKKNEEAGKIERALKKSPINYFSDLFVAAMVVCWILIILLMATMAVYATVRLADTSIWCELGSLVAIPLSCGGAAWMIKNTVQHAIANQQGRECPQDFAAVDEAGEIRVEERAQFGTSDESAAAEDDGETVG